MPYTLTVNFTLANPNPGSYRVKFWPTSDPTNITTRLVSGSPFVETGLTQAAYSGTIEASCGNGTYSSPVSFSEEVLVDVYLTAGELDLGVSGNGIAWVLSNSANPTIVSPPAGNVTVPFDIEIAYNAEGTGISGGISSPLLISGLGLAQNTSAASQGTTASNWTGVNTVSVRFREPGSSTWTAFISTINSSGTPVNQPLVYTRPDGSKYRFNISKGTNFSVIN